MKVLIVDDEVVIRNGMANVVPWEKYGFQLLTPAASGEEAVIQIEKEQPDIIISDIQMGGMSGLELINQLADFTYPKEVIILTGYDEFDYVQEAIKQNVSDYLLKTSSPEEILQSVDKARERLKETRRYLALEESKSEQKINSAIIRLLDKPLPGAEFAALIAEIPELAGVSLQLFVIHTVVDEARNYQYKELWNTYLHGKWVTHNGKTLIIVPRKSDVSDDYVLQMAAKKINELYNEPLYMSSVIPSLNELSSVYEQISLLSLYKWLLPDEIIISANKVKNREGILHLDEFKQYETELLECIRYGDKASLEALVRKFVSWAFAHPMATPNTIERYIQNLYFSAVRYIDQVSNQDNMFAEFQATEQYFSNPVEALTSLFANLLTYVKANDKGPNKYVIDAVQYITDHLNESITLQEVALHVHVHPNYLSEMIRKITNKSYLELLTDQRMERAQHYLVNSPLRVGEICKLVGYSDRKHFTKIFKRYFDKTPSEYRKQQSR